jgi:hypothetical protein
VLRSSCPECREVNPTTGSVQDLHRFLAAAELIESDLWIQYAELGGIGDNKPVEVDPNPSINKYQVALSNLDSDGPQYISSHTLDEQSHAAFLNAYLDSRGAEPVNFDEFRTLEGSTATGSSGIKRLTNLMHLNVDTSWYIRYRSVTNPDPGATFPQAIKLQNVTAIPRNNNDFNGTANPNFLGNNHIQAIANTFHFGYIEQGGSSLYAALGRKVTDLEVLEITQGIGGDEIAHFLEWVDFAGNGVQRPVAPFSDSVYGLSFPDFFNPLNPLIQPSLIFPVPCEFISPKLPHVSIIRPLRDRFAGAVATIASFTADGLFYEKPGDPQHTENHGRRSRCSRPLSVVTLSLNSCSTIRKPSALFKLFQIVEATDPTVLVLRHCFSRAETFMRQDKFRSLFKITQRDCYQCLLARFAGPAPGEREQLVRNNLQIKPRRDINSVVQPVHLHPVLTPHAQIGACACHPHPTGSEPLLHQLRRCP